MNPIEPEALAITCARGLEDRKAEDVLILRVGELTFLGDYFLIATGRNPRHLRAMMRQVGETVDGLELEPLGEEGTPESGWILVDLGDVIVHLFDPQRRRLYSLETLWGDAPLVEQWRQQEPEGEANNPRQGPKQETSSTD